MRVPAIREFLAHKKNNGAGGGEREAPACQNTGAGAWSPGCFF
jgi:hypothetical protein